jgi:hypothetical protein
LADKVSKNIAGKSCFLGVGYLTKLKELRKWLAACGLRLAACGLRLAACGLVGGKARSALKPTIEENFFFQYTSLLTYPSNKLNISLTANPVKSQNLLSIKILLLKVCNFYLKLMRKTHFA